MKLGVVDSRKFFQFRAALGGQFHIHTSAIPIGRPTLHQMPCLKPIHEFACAVRGDLQPLRKLSNRDSISAGEAFYGQQRQVLLRRQKGIQCRLLAEPQKLPQLVSEGSEGFIIVFSHFLLFISYSDTFQA